MLRNDLKIRTAASRIRSYQQYLVGGALKVLSGYKKYIRILGYKELYLNPSKGLQNA